MQKVSDNTLQKFFKTGVMQLQNPEKIASGCSVEAVFLDANGLETTEKCYGTVNDKGEVVDSQDKSLGVTLKRPGIYKVYFIGDGMNFLEDGLTKPYFEIFNSQSTKGFATSIQNNITRVEIDYENANIKFFNSNELVLSIGRETVGGSPGLKVEKGGIIEVITNLNLGAVAGIRSEVEYLLDMLARSGVFNTTATKPICLDLTCGLPDDSISGQIRINQIMDGVFYFLKTFFVNGENFYFLFDDLGVESFHRGKLGIGEGKSEPAEDVDVAGCVRSDTGFKFSGSLDGVGQTEDVDLGNGTILIFKGGIYVGRK